MIKLVSTIAGLAAPAFADFSSSLLTGVIPEPQTRWSPGGLVSAIVDKAADPLLVIVTAEKVLAFNDLHDDILAIFGDVVTASGASLLVPVLTPADGPTRARELLVAGNPVSVISSVDSTEVTPESALGSICAAVPPRHTVKSLVDSLDAFCLDNDVAYVGVINQIDGTVRFYDFEGNNTLKTGTVDDVIAITADCIVAAFSLSTQTSGTPGVVSFPWEK